MNNSKIETMMTFTFLEDSKLLNSVIYKNRITFGFKNVEWYCYPKILWKFLNEKIKRIEDVELNDSINFYNVVAIISDIRNYFVLEREIKEPDDFIRIGFQIEYLKEKRFKGFIYSNFSGYRFSDKKYNCELKIIYVVPCGIEMSIYNWYFRNYDKLNAKIVKEVHESIKDVSILEIKLLSKRQVYPFEYIEIYRGRIENIWEFLSQFKSIDDLILYILKTNKNALKVYKDNYNNLIWKKYKL